ncbi:MAG: hypothetical protein QNJ98_02555 [Planctomycetota bacterium]|nr:hypothetical protein [Planctomycetota bacterium]
MRRARTLLLLLATLAVLGSAPTAANDEAQPLWRRCYDAIPWFHAAEVPDTEAELLDLVMGQRLVAHSETWVRKAIADAPPFPDVLARARETKKLVLWYVPHVEGQHMILPHLLDRYMMVGPLSHPDVTSLVDAHFVPIKLPLGGPLAARLGLTAPGFLEPALLVIDEGGKIVHRLDRISVFDPAWVRARLVDVLRSRDIEPTAPPAAPTAKARTLIGRGDFETAVRTLRTLDKASPNPTARAEIGYHLGYALYFAKQEAEAQRVWAATAKRYPDSIWAAKAAAYAGRGTDGAFGEGPLGRSMLNPLRPSPPKERTLEREAVRFLLVQQRSDGTWEGPRWGKPKAGSEGQPGFGNIKTAITALCCAALHAWRDEDPKRVSSALKRGEAWLLSGKHVTRGDAIVWTYADAFRLLHFARRLPTLEPGMKRRVRRRMQGWIRHLVEHQKENEGSFRHYTYRSTFVTATVTYCLHVAKEAGLDVPKAVFAQAAERLEKARGGPRGLYGYLLDAPQVTRTLKGASGRHPLCEWTLFLVGRRSAEDLHAALEVFFEGYANFERARKTNFHIPALDNTCGYYFFHDVYPACEAAKASGVHAKANARRLRTLIEALPDDDGTFIDAGFSYGKSYSTAMALLSLRALDDVLRD